MRRSLMLLVATALAFGALAPASASSQSGATTDTQDVIGQGPDGTTVAEDGATLRRADQGFNVQVRMPTPEPGSYAYPEEDDTATGEGHPEGFTLWLFVFDEEQGPAEIGGVVMPWSSAFFVTGHLVGGDQLTLSGRVDRHDERLGLPLENVRDVDVHLAVAPHGGLDPDLMPEQIKTPSGHPPDWWHASFGDPIFGES